MNDPRPPANTPDEDALFAFGDDLNAAPANDLEATVRRLQRATSLEPHTASSIPTDLKRQIWEDLMHAQTASANPNMPIAHLPSRTVADLVSARPHTQSPPHARQPRLTRAVARWQPAVSLAVVLAFLVGLIGVAYQRGVLNEPTPPEPSGAASQVMYDGNDASTYPEVPAQCATNGPVESDAFYMDMSIQDLPQPDYTPVQAVTPDVGERIQDTYLRYARCKYESTEDYPYPAATPASYSDVLSPLALSYLSDRERFLLLYRELDATQQADINAYHCGRIGDILSAFPLPLNQPLDYALISSTVDNLPGITLLAFAPSDVYLLPDGRFGAVMGSVSTTALIDPTSATQDDSLSFIAFVERDGRYLIDEEFVIFPRDIEGRAEDYFPSACE